MRRIERPALVILHPESIQSHAIRHGMDARIHNAGPRHRQRASDFAEKPGMVGAIDRHFRDGAIFQNACAYRERRLCGARFLDHGGVARMGFRIKGKPIARITKAKEMIDFRPRMAGQQFGRRILGARHAHIAFRYGKTAGQYFGNAPIEFAQQRGFPAIPDLGADSAHIGNGQHQQKAQPFRALHNLGDVQDGFRVFDIAAEGGFADQQMMQHQPGNGLRLLRCQAKRGADMQRQFRAQFGMITAAPLGGIMQQHRNKKRTAGLHLADQFTGHRRHFGQFAAFHGPQHADRFNRMLIDRKHMIGVELHQPDHALPIGQKGRD